MSGWVTHTPLPLCMGVVPQWKTEAIVPTLLYLCTYLPIQGTIFKIRKKTSNNYSLYFNVVLLAASTWGGCWGSCSLAGNSGSPRKYIYRFVRRVFGLFGPFVTLRNQVCGHIVFFIFYRETLGFPHFIWAWYIKKRYCKEKRQVLVRIRW